MGRAHSTGGSVPFSLDRRGQDWEKPQRGVVFGHHGGVGSARLPEMPAIPAGPLAPSHRQQGVFGNAIYALFPRVAIFLEEAEADPYHYLNH